MFIYLLLHSFIPVPRSVFQVCIDLLVLSDRYNFVRLHKDLEKLLCEEVSINNVLQLMFYADSCNARRLYSHCTSLIDANAESVLASKAVLDLPIGYMKLLLSRYTYCMTDDTPVNFFTELLTLSVHVREGLVILSVCLSVAL